jgi:hypothetical protein
MEMERVSTILGPDWSRGFNCADDADDTDAKELNPSAPRRCRRLSMPGPILAAANPFQGRRAFQARRQLRKHFVFGLSKN